MNFLFSRKDHVRHENYSQRHKWPATWGYLVDELLIFQERSCETRELLSETQMASYLGLSCWWTSYLPGKIMWDMRITLRDTNGQLPGVILFINFLFSRKDHVSHENYSQRHKWPATWGYLVYERIIFQERSCETRELLSETQMASYLGLSCLWTSYFPGKIMWDTRITLRDINGQLPGAILFMNFLSSRKDHVRHENYSQRHKWPATWGYLVYERIIFQERSCETRELLSETQMASYLGLSCLWTSYFPGKIMWDTRITLRDINGQLPGAILFMNFLSSRKDHVRHENYSQRHKWPATWGYLVDELPIFQERSCETWELLSEIQMASYLGLSCWWTSDLPGKIMWDTRITLRDINGQLPVAILFMNFLSSRKDHVRHENYSQRYKWPATWGYLVDELLIFQERSCETWELLSEIQMASYLGLSCWWTSDLPGKIM